MNNMKKINALFFWVGLAMVLIALVWSIVLEVQTWDTLLTKYQELVLKWKPITMSLLGSLFMIIGIYKK
jgi:hypothetical protein